MLSGIVRSNGLPLCAAFWCNGLGVRTTVIAIWLGGFAAAGLVWMLFARRRWIGRQIREKAEILEGRRSLDRQQGM